MKDWMIDAAQPEPRFCAKCGREITGKSHFCSAECALKRHPIAEALARAVRARLTIAQRSKTP